MDVRVSDVAGYYWCAEQARLRIYERLKQPTTPEQRRGTAVHEWLEKRPGFQKPPALKLRFAGWDLTGHPDDFVSRNNKLVFIEYKTSANARFFNVVARLQLQTYIFMGYKSGIGLDYGILVHLDGGGAFLSRQTVNLPYNFDNILREVLSRIESGSYRRPVEWKCKGCWEGFKHRCRFQQSAKALSKPELMNIDPLRDRSLYKQSV